MIANLQAWRACRRGVAAVEFALVAPLLMAVLAVAIETGRAYLAYRCFENALSGTARQLASYPEYDLRARSQALFLVPSLLPPDGTQRFNLQVTSLKDDQGAMTSVFTHTLFGTNPNLPLSSAIKASQFEQSESVIYLAGTYDYVPLFQSIVGSSFRMTKTLTINPYFSRTYVWNDKQSADVYVR